MKKLSDLIVLVLAILLAVAASGCTRKARMARHLTRADKAFAAGQYDEAEIEYISVVRLDSHAAKAYEQLGIMAYEQGRIQRAYSFLLKSVQLDTNNLDYHVKFGLASLLARQREKARVEAVFVLNRRPADPDAPGLLVDSAATLKELEQIKAYLEKLNVPESSRAPIEVALGNIALKELDQTAAATAFERAKAANPNFGPLYEALGNFYWAKKQLKEADEAFKKSADTASIRSPRRMAYAHFKIETGDVAGGIKIMEDIAEKAPDYLPALTTLAGVEIGEKHYDKGDEWLSKTLFRDADNYDALLMSGRLGIITGSYDKAQAQFEKLNRAYPKSPQVLYFLAQAYNGMGDTTKAFATLNQIISQYPNFAEAIMFLAQMKVAKGDYSSAIVSLRDLIQQQPKLLEAQLLLAQIYLRQGDLEAAVRVCRQLETLLPDNVLPVELLGVILRQEQKPKEARQAFEKALELAPEYLPPVEQLVGMDIQDNNFSAALQRVQKLIEKSPQNPQLGLLKAKIYIAQNNMAEATATLLKLLETQPDFVDASFALAQIYADANQNEKALETLHALLAKHPDQRGSWMLVGVTEDKLKNYNAAKEAYEKLLALDPRNGAALNNLAFLYSEHEHLDLDRAYDLAVRAKKVMPYDSATGDTLGWILYKRGDFPQAANVLQESATPQPGEPEIQFHLGMALYMVGDEEAARAALQKALQAKPELPGLDEAKKRLGILAIDVKTAGPEVRATLEKHVAELPDDPIALGRLAAIYKRDGDKDKAIQTYEAALKISPKNGDNLLALAQLYSTQPGQMGRALELAKQAYKLAPDKAALTLGHLSLLAGDYKFSLNLLQGLPPQKAADPEVLYDLAQATYSQGQVADAKTDMQRALQTGGSFSHAAEAKQFLDMIALAANPEQALAATSQVEQSLKTNPTLAPALMARGIIREQKADSHAAIQSYEKMLAIYPDFAPAKRRLAILYAQSGEGDNKNAYDMAIQSHTAFPDDVDVTKALGIIMYRQGNYSRSAERLKESAATKKDDAQLIYYLGMDQYQLKQRVESKKNLQRALELKLPDNLAGEARRILAELK